MEWTHGFHVAHVLRSGSTAKVQTSNTIKCWLQFWKSILKSWQPTNEFFEGFQYIRWSISKTGKDKPCCSTVQQEVSKISVEHVVKVSMQPGLLESWINRKWGIQCYRIALMNCLIHFSPGKIFADNFVMCFFFFFNIPPNYFFQIEHGLSK